MLEDVWKVPTVGLACRPQSQFFARSHVVGGAEDILEPFVFKRELGYVPTGIVVAYGLLEGKSKLCDVVAIIVVQDYCIDVLVL